METYGKDIDVRKLQNQLELSPDIFVSASGTSSCDKVATVRQLAELLDKAQLIHQQLDYS